VPQDAAASRNIVAAVSAHQFYRIFALLALGLVLPRVGCTYQRAANGPSSGKDDQLRPFQNCQLITIIGTVPQDDPSSSYGGIEPTSDLGSCEY
jgi:hypothetical protein